MKAQSESSLSHPRDSVSYMTQSPRSGWLMIPTLGLVTWTLVGARMATRSLQYPPHPVTGDRIERQAFIGTSQHRSITVLAQTMHPGPRPSWDDANDIVHVDYKGYQTMSVRGAKVDTLLGVWNWVKFQWPPEDWTLLGVEADDAPGGRPDLWWRTGDGRVLGDEIKTGRSSEAWRTQIAAQLKTGRARFGDAFIGVRLFRTLRSDRSLWIASNGARTPLEDTEFWFEDQRMTGEL